MATALRIAACAAAAGILVAACGSAAPAPPPPGLTVSYGTAARVPSVSAAPYAAADTAFGLDVLGAWCRQDSRANILLSPESLASGLGLAYLGAGGATAAAMARVLHLPAAGPALEAGLHARSAALRGLDGPGVTVSGSDRVWADPSLITRPGYLDRAATAYGAGLWRAPLLRDPAGSAARIDAAIAAATRGRIPHLLSGGDLRNTGWVLTDALYLNAAWASPFEASQTSPGSFTTAAGSRASARFMHGAGFFAASDDGWTAVSLPYRGGKLAMTALLPPAGSGGCPALPVATLHRLTAALAPFPPGHAEPGAARASASVALPKVSLRTSASMRPLLTRLGLGIAFGHSADFTALSPEAASLGVVIHAATLAVTEKGTVASAATAVGIQPSALPLPMRQVVFDRPYLMLVTGTATGEPLFLARVADPG
ncbi:MAG TPA: serpin family protein [Streptosporangiaceae bacterium]|nr:serpin family protein [Streptosporangiaceae bacterium]